ncbi:MAG: hypothetical protein ACLS45_00725 [Subdoligranulum sp.]
MHYREAVRIAVRLEIANGRIAELRQIVAEQAQFEQEFSEKLKGCMSDGPLCSTTSGS